MALTHTIEIQCINLNNGDAIIGEVAFDGGQDLSLSFEGFEIGGDQLVKLRGLLDQIVNLTRVCGEVQKIEIVKKP